MKAKRLVFTVVCALVLLGSIGGMAVASGYGFFKMNDPFKLNDYTTISVTATKGGTFSSDRYSYSAKLIDTTADRDHENYTNGHSVKWTVKKGNWDYLRTVHLYWGKETNSDSVKVWSLKGGVKVYCGFAPQDGDKYYHGMVNAE